ncbi:MAG TPA: ATP-binding cassette domain-containing protein [Actinomycetota bacterium]|nr:ATP-binding cassette domain-containing protein [Actinomycetota bacterium]
MSAIIEIEGLRKEYRGRRGPTVAVGGLDLAVPDGGVFGFLGPNGSGKTTTIRCLLGLVRPSAGRCSVLGVDAQIDLHRVIGRIGAIVETPAAFPTMSGRKNLSLVARVDGIGPRSVDAALDRVGLGERADDLVNGYSLGMRQRLGIAAALLKDPALVVLDEPANGLDPAGIVEVRELLRDLGREGRTVFVSSHLLSEVQQTCDRVAILARGRAVAAGPVHEVLSAGRGARLVVRVDDTARGLDVLCAAGIPAAIRGEEIRVALEADQAPRITRALADAGLYLSELRRDEVDLETVFLELTREPHLEEVPA